MKHTANISWIMIVLVMILTSPFSMAGETRRIPLASEGRTYEYRGTVAEGKRKGEKEIMTLSFRRSGTNIVCRSRIEGKDKLETATAWITSEGKLISAERRLRVGSEQDNGKIWTRKNDAFIWRELNGKPSTRKKTLSGTLPVLADISVLAFMRSLPFEVGKSTTVQIIGYRQNVVEAKLTTVAEETVATPAGKYDCYKVELLVQVLFFKKRIEYWLSKEAPHFMVRHRGLRGAGSPIYDTVLERIVPAASKPREDGPAGE